LFAIKILKWGGGFHKRGRNGGQQLVVLHVDTERESRERRCYKDNREMWVERRRGKPRIRMQLPCPRN
jgi:hypothetical protein